MLARFVSRKFHPDWRVINVVFKIFPLWFRSVDNLGKGKKYLTFFQPKDRANPTFTMINQTKFWVHNSEEDDCNSLKRNNGINLTKLLSQPELCQKHSYWMTQKTESLSWLGQDVMDANKSPHLYLTCLSHNCKKPEGSIQIRRALHGRYRFRENSTISFTKVGSNTFILHQSSKKN